MNPCSVHNTACLPDVTYRAIPIKKARPKVIFFETSIYTYIIPAVPLKLRQLPATSFKALHLRSIFGRCLLAYSFRTFSSEGIGTEFRTYRDHTVPGSLKAFHPSVFVIAFSIYADYIIRNLSCQAFSKYSD